MSIELLAKNTADVFGTFMKLPRWNKGELQEGIKKIIGQVRESAGSNDEYLESLLRNVTFQYANTNTAISFLTQCIEEEKFLTQEDFQTIMANVPRQVQESNFIAENMPRFKDVVYKGTTIEEQVVHAERFYLHSKLVNDLFVEFIGTFLYTENRNFMVNFLEYSSKVVVETVIHYCQNYATAILEELYSVQLAK